MYFTVNNINTTYYTNNGILNKTKTTPEHGSTNEIKTGKWCWHLEVVQGVARCIVGMLQDAHRIHYLLPKCF